LGLSGCLAKDFAEGKRSFIFAGSEGSPEAQGEWPRSSRTLLHRVAPLALAGSSTDGSGGRGQGYRPAACQGACDVIRSCILAPECRAVLTQSGFLADAVAQVSVLCGKAGTRGGAAALSRAAQRAGDLLGVLVNASLRVEGQKALTQVDGVGDMLGNLLDVCLRATNEGGGSSRDVAPFPPVVARTLLLLRNLALAPSTGQV
ncbi:unnamed protein product, partial [Laminaria digitata]